jgi:alpha/beta superfamily hydrolase
MTNFVEELFTVISPRYQHKLSCIFHRKTSPYIDEQNREHVVIICHGYMSNKNAIFLPQLSRDISNSTINQFHSVRFDFHGCGESTGREEWDYGGYEDEAKDDLRSIVEYLRSTNEKYFIRALIGHSRAGTTVLLYAFYYDDIPIIVNIAGRYRLERGINERFSKKQLDELEKNGSFIIHSSTDGDFRITKKAIERRKNLDISKISKIRHAKVLNIWGDQDDVIPGDDVYFFNEQLQNTKKTEMIIVSDADHCFLGKERELIHIIQSWIQQSID